MANSGMAPKLSIYAALICALCKTCRTEEAQNLFECMLEKQWNSNDVVWTVLTDGLLKEGMSNLCLKFLHIMESKNCSLNLQTYVTMARELSKVDKSTETGHLDEQEK